MISINNERVLVENRNYHFDFISYVTFTPGELYYKFKFQDHTENINVHCIFKIVGFKPYIAKKHWQ